MQLMLNRRKEFQRQQKLYKDEYIYNYIISKIETEM